MGLKDFFVTSAILIVGLAGTAQAQIRITEWEYNGFEDLDGGEFVELTNVGSLAIDMTGYSFSDEDAEPGTTDLSGFGLVAPGESVILAEDPADTFRTVWGLGPEVKVVGENADNLGRQDAIYIFDGSDAPVDVLDFGDGETGEFPGSIRTAGTSGVPINASVLGLGLIDPNAVLQWKLSVLGDEHGSYMSSTGLLGNPGTFTPVPEPATIALVALGALAFVGRRRAK